MRHSAKRLVLACALALASGCKKNNPPAPAARADAATAAPTLAPLPVDNGPLEPPRDAIFVLRGSALRKVLNIVAPGAPPRLVLGQMGPNFSPGLGEHGVDVDADAPFAAVMVPRVEGERGHMVLVIAWPLRSGMQIAQDAAAGRGFREVTPGLYEPTGASADHTDAGAAAAENPCWVARKAPVGWMLVCGPSAMLRSTANFLVRAGSRSPDGDPVLDVTFRPEPARPLLVAQLASLEAQDPRRHDAGANAALVAQYDEVHRSAVTYREIVEDLSSLHATLTLDDAAYHLRAEAEMPNATGANTRAILASTLGRRAAGELLGRLPATSASHVAFSLDGAAMRPLLGGDDDADDPRVLQALGPEFLRFQQALHALTGLRSTTDRAMGFMTDDGGTKIEVMRRENPAAALASLRAVAAAVPRTPRPSGLNAADQFAILPVPAGLPAGSLRLRLSPDPARLPPDAPAELRRLYSRSTLLVPDGDKLFLIDAADPVARWNALQSGPRLAVTLPENASALMHLSPAAALMLLGVPPSTEMNARLTREPVHGVLTARRAGDAGGHFEATIDAPIVTVNQVRDEVGRIQAEQGEAMQRQQQAVRQQQAAQQAARRAGGAQRPGAGGMMMPPPGSPDQLPEPNFQLRPPPQ